MLLPLIEISNKNVMDAAGKSEDAARQQERSHPAQQPSVTEDDQSEMCAQDDECDEEQADFVEASQCLQKHPVDTSAKEFEQVPPLHEFEIFGFDISKRAVDEIRANPVFDSSLCRFDVVDAQKDPFPPYCKEMDVALLIFVLSTIDPSNMGGILKKIHEVERLPMARLHQTILPTSSFIFFHSFIISFFLSFSFSFIHSFFLYDVY